MSIYRYQNNENNENNLYLSERNIYGSSRIGMEQVEQIIASSDPGNVVINDENGIYNGITNQSNQYIGDKRYELANHLGNVLEVITDRKVAIDFTNYDPNTGTYTSTLADGSLDYYTADVISQNDYFPFACQLVRLGMLLPNRHESTNEYRYGFQRQEKDNKIKGEGNSVNYKYRMHDARIGRWFSIDRLFAKYPNQSPYFFVGGNPIINVDFDGNDYGVIFKNQKVVIL